jgi:hypothetical protein
MKNRQIIQPILWTKWPTSAIMWVSSFQLQGMTFPWSKGVGNGCGIGETFVLPREWPSILAKNKRFKK